MQELIFRQGLFVFVFFKYSAPCEVRTEWNKEKQLKAINILLTEAARFLENLKGDFPTFLNVLWLLIKREPEMMRR